MKSRIAAVAASAVLASLAFSTASQAQNDDQEFYVYSSYLRCTAAKQADSAVEQAFKGVYDAAVKDGTISAWGWMRHQTGGDWTRAVYHAATSMKALFAASATLDERTGGKDFDKANKQFMDACPSHEDYIWRRVAGSDGSGDRGKVGFSVYYVCDSSREDQADELVKRVFAPVYDKLVADGKLKSWGWMEHIVGGKYRRLATMTAADVGTLMEARGAIVATMSDDPLASTLDAICGSHSDYIWGIGT